MELLAVIAIIAILALLLLPVLGSLPEHYRETVCQSNLRQLAIAAVNFNSDTGRLPKGSGWVTPSGGGGWNWTITSVTNGTLWPYMHDAKPYLCQSFYLKVKDMTPVGQQFGAQTARSYAINAKADTIPNLSQIHLPSTKVFFTEENWYAPTIIGGVAMSSMTYDNGACAGYSGINCAGTFHRFDSSMAAYFDGHAGRFIMDAGQLFRKKFLDY